MKTLAISPDLPLPMAAVTEVLGFLGRRGQGKSYAAQKLAELMYDAGAPFVALDPVGNWFGLRLGADGRSPGIPVPVFGGLHGDVPLEPTAGKLVADLIVDRGISAVLDVSQFESDADKARFAHDFGARFYFRRKQAPAAVHLFMEECQEFVPQQPMGDENRVLHVFQRIIKLGRNYGIGVSLISQRPQEVHKKVLNLTELLFVFQLTGPHERKAVQGWIQEKGIDEDIAAELPKLKQGHPHAWSPAWLQISKVVRIAEKQTFDASSTPAVGKAAASRELAPIDLEKLRQDMAATIEKAKADDPRELRKQIKDLRAELAVKVVGRALREAPVKTVEKFVLTDADRALLIRIDDSLAVMRKGDVTINIDALVHAVQKGVNKTVAAAHKTIVAAIDTKRFQELARKLALQEERAHVPTPTTRQEPVARSDIWSAKSRSAPKPEPTAVSRDPERRILNALAWWEAAGVDQPTRHQVAFVARYSVNGHFNNQLGTLRTNGLVEYPAGGTVSLTKDGRARAEAPESGPSREELILRVGDVLRKEPQRRIFTALVDVCAAASGRSAMLTREDLASRCHYSVNGHFNNTLGSLRALGIVDYPRGGYVGLSDLFKEF